MIQKYADQSTYFIDTFVTGGTGFIGRWLLAELTRRGRTVLVPVREAARRADELAAFVERLGGDASRLRIVEGDLDRDHLGLSDELRASLGTVRHLFHAGARFEWGLTPEVAHRTNVAGSRRVVDLAATMPALERLVLVGGYRIATRIDGSGRSYLPDARELASAGAYEASKHHAHREAVALAAERSVPTSAVHPSTVIGDSRTGETTQRVGLAETILALAARKLPARVGSPRTFVPLVAVDFVARVMVELADDPDSVGRELVLLDARTPVLDALIDRAAAIAAVPAPRLRLPVGVVRCLPEAVTKTSREALAFLDDARYDVAETDAWLARRGLAHPDVEPTFERWVRALIADQPARTDATTARRSTLPLGSVGNASNRA